MHAKGRPLGLVVGRQDVAYGPCQSQPRGPQKAATSVAGGGQTVVLLVVLAIAPPGLPGAPTALLARLHVIVTHPDQRRPC